MQSGILDPCLFYKYNEFIRTSFPKGEMYEKWKKKSHKEIGGEAAEDDHSFGPSRSSPSSGFSSESKESKYDNNRKRGKGIVAAGGMCDLHIYIYCNFVFVHKLIHT